MHIRVSRPPSRVERVTTSCGECRRRKQKCNQEQPCGNCARRYPRPLCEYRSTGRRHFTSRNESPQHSAASTLSVLYAEDAAFQLAGACEPLLATRQPSPLHAPYLESQAQQIGEVVKWSGIDLLTRFPGCPSASHSPWSFSWASAPGGVEPSQLPCAIPSDAVLGSNFFPQSIQDISNQFTNEEWHPDRADEVLSWLMIWGSEASSGSPWSVANPAPELINLPVVPAMQNSDLFRIFVRSLSRFQGALDGNPDSSNSYVKYYLPFCLQSPLLTQVGIYTSACFLNETGYMDKTVAMAHKGQAIGLLNEHIHSQSCLSDEAIAGITQLILDEWYWGETNDLRAHLRGLREMIRLRGGFRSLGLHGLISKMAITTDISIALSFEIQPFLQHGREFEMLESTQVPLRLAQNTPLVSPLPTFASCTEALKLDPATASILDDMRFLISAVLALPDNPSAKELHKVHTTSAWIYNRTSKLSDYSPLARRSSAALNNTDRTPVITIINTVETEDGVILHAGGSPQSQHNDILARRGSYQSIAGCASEAGAIGQQEDRYPHGNRAAQPLAGPMESPDFLYQCVRLAALMYSRAVMERQPFSSVVDTADFLRLWTTMWRVPLTTWKGVLGVLNWIILPITPAACGTRYGRLIKSMLTNSALQMSLDNWEVASCSMKAALSLQRWLGQGQGDGGRGLGAMSATSSDRGRGTSFDSSSSSLHG